VNGRRGVWVDKKKIGFAGVGVSRWVSYHGVSVNINADLGYFSMIRSCGIKGVEVTSLSGLLGNLVDMKSAKEKLIEAFNEVFGSAQKIRKFPPWLKKDISLNSQDAEKTCALLKDLNIKTVCQSARCPNLNECFQKKRATFLVMGNVCTRACAYCSIHKGRPLPLDLDEPRRIARFAKEAGMNHVIITSVTRDDLEDGGSGHFVACIEELRRELPEVKIEVLTPDFGGKKELLRKVLQAAPHIFAHNMETVERLYQELRPGADYRRSLEILENAHDIAPSIIIKSGIMVGLGETEEEVLGLMADLRKKGSFVLSVGQYLKPSDSQIGVSRFIEPGVFNMYKIKAIELGFSEVASSPFARSSY